MPIGSEHLRERTEKPAAPASESRESKPARSKGKAKPVDPCRFPHLADKHGLKFDPALHKTEDDGQGTRGGGLSAGTPDFT